MISSSIKENVKAYLVAVGLVAVTLIIVNVLQTGCPIRFLTGIPCMGCGLTRAGLALLNLDFRRAFYYNPCIYLLVVSPVWVFVRKDMQRRLEWVLVLFACISYMVRTLIGNPIVQWEIQEGFFYKNVIKYLMEVL